MEENKVILGDGELEKDYLLADPGKTRRSTKVIDIIIACLGILAGGLLGFLHLYTGIPGNDLNEIVLGSVGAGIAVLLIIFIIVVAKSKSGKVSGGIYPLALLLYLGGTCGTIVYQRMSNGWSFFAGNLWRSPITFGVAALLALIGFILYLIPGRNYSPKTMIASYAFNVVPMVVTLKGVIDFLGISDEFQAFITDGTAVLANWQSFLHLLASIFIVLAILGFFLAYALRLLDRGNNKAYLTKQIEEREVKVEVVKKVPYRPRKGLLIVKSPKNDEPESEAPAEEAPAEEPAPEEAPVEEAPAEGSAQ